MANFNWVRKNLVTEGSPLYVYECEDLKVPYAYDSLNPERFDYIKINLYRVAHFSKGWEVLKWQWSCVKGQMMYVRDGGMWGYKTKKAAIEDAEYEIEKRKEWYN